MNDLEIALLMFVAAIIFWQNIDRVIKKNTDASFDELIVAIFCFFAALLSVSRLASHLMTWFLLLL